MWQRQTLLKSIGSVGSMMRDGRQHIHVIITFSLLLRVLLPIFRWETEPDLVVGANTPIPSSGIYAQYIGQCLMLKMFDLIRDCPPLSRRVRVKKFSRGQKASRAGQKVVSGDSSSRLSIRRRRLRPSQE
jgi:hypothetical protein